MSTLDEIAKEKQRIGEALARADAPREKLTGQLSELEAAERVLARYSKGTQTKKAAAAKTPTATTKAAAVRSRGRRRGPLQDNKLLAEKCHLGFASRTRSEQSDEQSAEQLQEVDHLETRIAHRGICASPDAIFGSHRRLRAAIESPQRTSISTQNIIFGL